MAKQKKSIYNNPNSLFFGLDDTQDEVLQNASNMVDDIKNQIRKENENVELQRLRSDRDDRTRVGTDRLSSDTGLFSSTDLQRDTIRSKQSEINGRDEWGRWSDIKLSTSNSDEMVQGIESSRLREGYNVNDINGTTQRNEMARRNGAQQGILDFDSQTNERNGQYGLGDTKSYGDRSLRNVLQGQEGVAYTSTGQTNDITIQHRGLESQSSNQLITSSAIQENFTAKSDFLFTGKKDKFKHNLEAIKLVKTLKSIQTDENKNNFTTTKEEKEILSKFGGWGNLPEVFDINKDDWEKERIELQKILTKSEWEEAMSTTTSAFYTPKIIVDTIYKSLERMGINNDDNLKEILEPSAGNGAFLSFASNHLKNYQFTTVEKNELSNNFLEFLYPKENILPATEFQNINYNKKFDAIIGNPPYGNERLADLNDKDLSGLSLHNYFLAKSQKLLKDDGICAFVVSSYFMDSKNNEVREAISKNSTFLGGVRLPNNAFKNAGTEVVTDILFFQKGINKELNHSWINTKDYIGDFSINEYFINNLQNVFGKFEITSSQFGNKLVCIEDENINLEQKLDNFINSLPKNIYKFHEQKIDETLIKITLNNEEYKNNKEYFDKLKGDNYLIFNNQIYKKQNSLENNILVLEKVELNKSDEERIRKYIPLRDTHIKLIDKEKENISDNNSELTTLREKLNHFYDEFHKNGDFLYNKRKSSILEKDTDFGKIKALEVNYEPAISPKVAYEKGISPKKESANKATILKERVIKPYIEPTFDNAIDGLYASINLYGKYNASYIADKLDKTRDEVTNELLSGGYIFLNPKILSENGYKEYIIKESYLSGDVKTKYKEAFEVAKNYPGEMANNLHYLKSVFPKDLKSSEISIQMGANWIPLEYYNQFFEEHFGAEKNNWSLSISEISGSWNFKGDVNAVSLFNQKKFSTDKKNIFEVGEKALSGGVFYITMETDEPKTYPDGSIVYDKNGKVVFKRILDAEATHAANQKVEALKIAFDKWIMHDQERRNHLTKIYNEKFNCYVTKNYDGSHLDFNSLNPIYKLRKHQKDAVYRAINDKNCLFDHEVGAGKTLSAICSVMKQKELGVINKPLIAVPNHLISQWENEFRKAYPNANILVADEKSTSKQNKDEFFGKMINGNYDAIIMTHTQLERVPAPRESMEKVINKQIAELQEVIDLKEQDENAHKLSVKQLVNRLNNEKEQLKKLIDEKNKTKLLDFSDFGIDCLVIDESHMFKNLKFATAKTIKGLGNTQGSQKAMDLYQKTTWMNDNDKKIIFLTGTPISNSLSELYSINKYLMPKEMESKDISSFDAWMNNFGKVDEVSEMDASAKKYKIVTRLIGLNNAPEACAMYNNVAYIVTNEDIKKYHKNYVPNKEIINEISPISPEVEKYIGIEDQNGNYNENSIIWRMENMPEDRSEDNFLKATGDAKKAGIDYRLIDEFAPDYEYNKINNCVKNIIKEYHNWDEEKGTQMVFLDIGTPKNRKQYSFNINIDGQNNQNEITSKEEDFVNINDELEKDIDTDFEEQDDKFTDDTFFLYGDLYKKLVNAGIPRDEIAFIHDTDGSNSKKLELFDKVNSGKVRILIGSTNKMGAGTNVQRKIVALHHLDVPWRPSDLTQRDGRGIRQGNELFLKDPDNFKIKIYRYATEKTYDAKSWEIIEQKSNVLVNFRKGLVDGRTLEGLEDEAASVSDMKAIATGDPLFLEQSNIERVLKKENALYKSYISDIQDTQDMISSNLTKIQKMQKDNISFDTAKEQIQTNKSDNFNCSLYNLSQDKQIKKFTILKDDKSDLVKNTQNNAKNMFDKNVDFVISRPNIDFEFGEYKGFNISAYYDSVLRKMTFELENQKTKELYYPENLEYLNHDSLFKDKITFIGFFKRMDNFLNVEKLTQKQNENIKEIEKLSKNNSDLEKFLDENKEYPKAKLIEQLEQDRKYVNNLINNRKKGKKSEFKSKALIQLENFNKKILKADIKNEIISKEEPIKIDKSYEI